MAIADKRSIKMMRKSYNSAFKVKVAVEALKEEKTVAAIAASFEI